MPRRALGLLLRATVGCLLISACTIADVQLTNTPVPTISGKAGSFDVVEIDQQNHRLYVADRTDKGIDVFDISPARATYLQTINLPASPNGLAIAPDLGRLFAGTPASIVIIDINPNSRTRGSIIKIVPTESGADLLDYTAVRRQLFASSGDGSITSIDAITGEIKGHFKLARTLEQPRFNTADGMLYVTNPDAGGVLRIDPYDGTIENTILLPKCQPSGLAINPLSNQALVACRNSVMSYDLSAGKAQVFEQVAGGDVVTYDATIDRFFVAAPKSKPASVIGIFGGNPIAYVTSIVTSGGGNSAAYDETNDIVYTPDIRPNKAGLTSFRLPAADQISPSVISSLGILAIVMVVIGLFLFVVARSADPIRRPLPEPEPATHH